MEGCAGHHSPRAAGGTQRDSLPVSALGRTSYAVSGVAAGV